MEGRKDGRTDGRMDGRKDGRLEIPPCVLQDIGPVDTIEFILEKILLMFLKYLPRHRPVQSPRRRLLKPNIDRKQYH